MAGEKNAIITNYGNFENTVFTIFCNFLAFSPFLCLKFWRLEIENKLELPDAVDHPKKIK